MLSMRLLLCILFSTNNCTAWFGDPNVLDELFASAQASETTWLLALTRCLHGTEGYSSSFEPVVVFHCLAARGKKLRSRGRYLASFRLSRHPEPWAQFGGGHGGRVSPPFKTGGHNMPCPPTFFSLGFVFAEVSKIKVMFVTFCEKSFSC